MASLTPIFTVSGWRKYDEAKYGGTFILGTIASEPFQLNPITTTLSNTHCVVPNIFNSLLFSDADWNLHPNLATDWEISTDGKTITFYLVQNATWHDGEKFTAEDVEFTVNEGWTNPDVCPYSPSIYGYLEEAQAIDDYTVELHLSSPFAPILLYLSTTLYGAIIPKHIYEGTDILENPANMEPIGTGPYIFKEWVHGDHITVVRNPNYFKEGLPYLNTIIHKIIPDAVSQINAMETGEIDGVVVPPQQVDIWEEDPRFYLSDKRRTAQAGMYIIQFNMNETRSPIVGGFSEEATMVRKALHHATDVDFIISQVFFGQVVKGNSPFPSVIWGNKDAAADDPREYDVVLANQMLDDAGYPVQSNGLRFELYMPYLTGGVEQQVAEYLRETWKDVYVQVNLEGMDRPPRLQKWGGNDFDVIYEGPYHGPDASVTTGRFYMTSNIKYYPYTNCQQYSRENVDVLFEQAQTTTDIEDRQTIYDEIQEIIWADCPTIWIGAKVLYDAFSVDFPGQPEGPFGNDDPLEITWWTGGSSLTPEGVEDLIAEASAKIEKQAGQFYNVVDARAKIQEAQEAYEAGDWSQAATLAEEATTLAKPPIMLYGGIIGVIVIAIGGIIWYRRRGEAQF
jgi:peptide/nickel transport system substrate-binding protein